MEYHKLLNRAEEAYIKQKPFVIYRKPTSDLLHFVQQSNDAINYTTTFNEKGFVFAPFEDIKKTILFSVTETNYFTAKIPTDLEIDINDELLKEVIDKEAKQNHIDLVTKAINNINRSDLKKIVLSRKEVVKYAVDAIFLIVKRLLQLYNNAFVYLWYHPKIGLWIGATPETLLKINENQFYTMALAGTQVYKDSVDVKWKEKEVQEQQYVTESILENLKNSIPNLAISKPYTVKAGNVLHIKTDIRGTLLSDVELGKIISILHPTPAVCGLPKEEAKQFILKNELYNREYYTGFLGELNLDNKSNLYVNLRCMQLKGDKVLIYVGGGITNESNPLKEWEETVLKSKVMKRAL